LFQAIEWAVSNEVDIISMSWTIDAAETDDINALKRAVERAGENGIIMYCAAKDEGKDAAKKEIYPYDSGPKVIKRIGATDSFGKKLRYVLERDTDYFLPGEDLTEQLPLQGTASVEETKNHREGSSEATALAAGLAALILACFAEVEGKKGIEYMRTSEHMNRVFDALAEYESMKYVMVWGFEASVKQKIPLPTNNARLAINGPQSDMKERMSRVANYCRRVIDHPGSVRSRNP
jgi:subtilisin family serine protease